MISVRTRAQMFFPNINRTQAAEIDLDIQTRPSEGPNTCPCEYGANPLNICIPTISCFVRIQIGLTFLMPVYPGCP